MIDYGIVRSDDANLIMGFEEKPEIRAVSMGVYVMSRALDYVPDGDYVDFPDLVQALFGSGSPRFELPVRRTLVRHRARRRFPAGQVEAWGRRTPVENGSTAPRRWFELPALRGRTMDLRRRAGSG